MQQALPWIIALAVLVVVAAGMAFWVTRPRQEDTIPLPTEWALGPRPVFSVDERRAFRHLRDCLPHHVVLAKLPLVRFCQPIDPNELRYWYELLGSTHISFAICSSNGRVLVAIDLDGERPASRRSQQIKQNMLSACRIRYLRCTIDHLPPAQELQLLVPQAMGGPAQPQMPADHAFGAPQTAAPTAVPPHRPAFAPAPAPARAPAAAVPASTFPPSVPPPAAAPQSAPAPQVVADVKSAESVKRRKDRKALWQDSGLFQDSFFGIDNLRDAGPASNFASGSLSERDQARLSNFGPSASEDRATLESQRPRRDPPR